MCIIRQMTSTKPLVLVSALIVLNLLTIAAFNPKVVVKQCTQDKIIVTLSDAEVGGIVYIQGKGSACKQITFSATSDHEFDFAACNLEWEKEFRVVVQKKALYQTGDDQVIPVYCFVDTSDITVQAGVNVNDKEADAGQNKTVKPHGIMRLYRGGVDVTGGDVKLSDFITMEVTLHENFLSDFDIKAKTCFASTIPIVNKECATDIELFPNFQKPSRGIISADFGAFRPTDLTGGTIAMAFTCTLQVCRNDCEQTTCNNGDAGWGRKKRSLSDRSQALRKHSMNKRAADEEDITVGTTLRIVAEEITIEGDVNDEVCMDTLAFIAGLVAIATALVASTAATTILARKVLRQQNAVKKLPA